MAAWLVGIGAVAIGAAAAAGGARLYQRRLRRARDDHSRRPALWNRLYALDWGDTTTNNYGFAPADGDHPQRYQHQMYRELLKRLLAKRTVGKRLRLLEVSCGRGGGLDAFLAAAPATFDATGLDVAASAVAFCRRTYGESKALHFVEGSALSLPFADGSFDVVLNVEASNDYGDRPRFFAEVARVLKRGGTFLYTDSFRSGHVGEMQAELVEAGFAAEFDDITANVAEACRIDTPRRRKVIRSRAPTLARLALGRQLDNYAAVEGSRKYQQFVNGSRSYLMTAATKK